MPCKTENDAKQKELDAVRYPKSQNLFLRVCGVLFLVVIYLGLMWFFDHRTSLEKFIGFLTLGVGAIVCLIPSELLGQRNWEYAMYIFYTLGLSLLIIV